MRLIGTIDGVEVTFDFYPPNLYRANIPKRPEGIYIVQLRLVDDAGNETGYTNIFIKIDFPSLTIESYKVPYVGTELHPVVMGVQVKSFLTSREILNDFGYNKIKERFLYREVVS